MARVIAIANRKGGVGKTTTTVSLGAALAADRKRVLLVDLDSQQSLCASLKVQSPKPGLGDVFFSQFVLQVGELREALVPVRGLMVAGGYDLAHIDSQLRYYGASWEHALDLALAPESSRFDFILLDCSPTLGCLTVNALTAADQVVIPVQTEFLAVAQLASTMSLVDNVKATTNPRLEVAGLLPTLFDVRTRHSVDVLMKISTEANRFRVRVFRPIPRTVRIAEAAACGKPITEYAPRSRASLAYEALAVELEQHPLSHATVSAPWMDDSQAFCERIAADAVLRLPTRATASA